MNIIKVIENMPIYFLRKPRGGMEFKFIRFTFVMTCDNNLINHELTFICFKIIFMFLFRNQRSEKVYLFLHISLYMDHIIDIKGHVLDT